MRFTILLAGLAACGTGSGEYNVTLAAYTKVFVEPDAQAMRILLDDAMPTIRSTACPLLNADVTGQLAGAPLSLTARGGKVDEDAGDDVSDNVCGDPIFQLDQPPPDGVFTLALSESLASITCDLPDLKAARTMTTASWDWTPGQAVELQWSPADDLTRFTGVNVTISHQDDAGTLNGETQATVTSVAGGRIDFTVPAIDAGFTGSYTVGVSMIDTVRCAPGAANATAPILATIGMASQLPVTQFSASHPITITP